MFPNLQLASHGDPNGESGRKDGWLGQPVGDLLLRATGIYGDVERGVGAKSPVGPERPDLGVQGEGKGLHDESGAEADQRSDHGGARLAQGREVEDHDVLQLEPLRDRVQARCGLAHVALAHAERVEAHPRSQRQRSL